MNSAESALVGHLFEKWTMKRIYNPNCLCKLFNSKPRCLQSLRLQTLEKIQFSSSLEDMIQSSRGHRGCHRDRFAEGRAHTHEEVFHRRGQRSKHSTTLPSGAYSTSWSTVSDQNVGPWNPQEFCDTKDL